MFLAPPERREEISQVLWSLRQGYQRQRYEIDRYFEQAYFRAVLERRPLSPFPRIENTIWYHYKLFAPELKPEKLSPEARRARKAYHLARRGKPEAALRELDGLIAQLQRDAAGAATRFEVEAYLFAGAVGYLVCEETAGAYYVKAVELAPYKTPALLVLGAIFVRLGRIDEARAAWNRALRIERERLEKVEQGPRTPGHWELLEDTRAEFEKLEAIVGSLDIEAMPRSA